KKNKYSTCGTASHQLSATALLPSPDGSRHPLDVYEFAEEDLPGSPGRRSASRGLWECLIGCRHKVDQQLARRRVEQGLRLYNQHKQQAAVRKWRSALKRIRKRDDKFALLGYLYQAYMDWGKYREALEFAHRQLGLAEEADSPNLRAEAYLNLARAHERLGGLERALAYARHSLYNECDQCRTAGHVHLTVGSVYLELAGFCKALEAFQHAHKIAQGIQDPALELQVYVGLSELFGRLQDADKSARYAAKAYDLSRSLQLGDLNSRHHRAALLQMASALRKQGELGDAHDYCSEATRLALVSGDQATYAKSIRIMGDIYRKKSEINFSRGTSLRFSTDIMTTGFFHNVENINYEKIATTRAIRNLKNGEVGKSAVATHAWSEKHQIKRKAKLIKQLEKPEELMVWGKKSTLKKEKEKFENSEIIREIDLI
ncbi:hypothetical protein L9F63_005267, partial [Diploptera punctata]